MGYKYTCKFIISFLHLLKHTQLLPSSLLTHDRNHNPIINIIQSISFISKHTQRCKEVYKEARNFRKFKNLSYLLLSTCFLHLNHP
ncbi:hypothetical protein Hanom_Chr12g01104031 [Helianthus anomalus]